MKSLEWVVAIDSQAIILKAFQKIMLKYFGIKVTQKGVTTKTLPIVGGLIGGAWNYIEDGSIKRRITDYFEGRYDITDGAPSSAPLFCLW